jgi:autotransporter-associated beta strand protein
VIGAGTLANPGTGTVNLLRGGTLTTMGIRQFNDAKATGSLYANGGELRVGGSNPVFMEGLDQAILGPAGLTVHTNGFNITIAQPLVAPSGHGLSSIPVAVAGSGYLAPPLIELTGGGGSGATAIAKVSDGSIGELILTNPGTGYTSPPVVNVLGGGSGSGLIAGTPTLSLNQGGGLTKVGPGTLTLTGASSFCGATVVKQGELQVDGDLSRACGPVEVAPLSRLSGAGQLGGDVTIAPGATLAPGQATGTLRLAGALVLWGTLAVSLRENPEEVLSVGGCLDLEQAKLTTTASGEITRQAKPIASYGTLNGKFAEISLPSGFKLDYHHGGRNVIALVPTAEADGK